MNEGNHYINPVIREMVDKTVSQAKANGSMPIGSLIKTINVQPNGDVEVLMNTDHRLNLKKAPK